MELQKTFSLYWATLLYMRLEKPSMKDIWYGSMTLSLWYFKNTTAQLYDPTSNPEEAEVEWFYEDLQDPLELTAKKKKKKRCPFHLRGLEYKSRNSRNTWSNRQILPWSTE